MKQIAKFLLDVVEVYVPTIAFTLLFIVFIIQVFFRYFLVPLTWPLEFTLIAFIWTTLLGACFTQRDYSHVQFTLIYDKAKPRTQIWLRIAGNSLLVAAFGIALYPSYSYVDFMSFKVSNVLKILVADRRQQLARGCIWHRPLSVLFLCRLHVVQGIQRSENPDEHRFFPFCRFSGDHDRPPEPRSYPGPSQAVQR
jgi:TRAP-type C4-dicarboxylate transport system permease small subunit